MSGKVIKNWSGNRIIEVFKFYEPSNTEELKATLLANSDVAIRFISSNMSPSGIALGSSNLPLVAISMKKLDKILDIDIDKKNVTIEAAVQIQDLLSHLHEYGLTLHNLPSTTGMTLAGLVQTSCHGSGKALPPLENAVQSITLMTVDGSEVTLMPDHGSTFRNALVSLGTFGAVLRMTLECIPAYILEEEIRVMGIEELRSGHNKRLHQFKHVKYHYLPYTDKVVVYTYREVEQINQPPKQADDASLTATASLIKLLHEISDCQETLESFGARHANATFSDLRGQILTTNPLNQELIQKLAKAELDYWIKMQGKITDHSHKRLMFDCGGRQCVKEMAFKVTKPGMDLDFVQDILSLIEDSGFPAPAPIEQRWSAPSRSELSPVFSHSQGDYFSWVGIIMYLTGDQDLDFKVMDRFNEYHVSVLKMAQSRQLDLQLEEHLAKIETKNMSDDLAEIMKTRLRSMQTRLKEFHKARLSLDPEGRLCTQEIEGITGFLSSSN